MIFVDTGAWFAYFVPGDRDHGRIRAAIGKNAQTLVTTGYCIDETLTLLTVRQEHRRAMQAGGAFFHRSICRLHFVSPDEIRRAWLIFQQRSAAGWSFTDCASKVVIDALAIRTVVALDAHFLQFGNVNVVP